MTNLIKWWDNDQMTEVKKLFAPNLNESEFQTFVWIWKATWLNPFLREIWAVKYWTWSANIFIGRDWYRKSAQANKEYDYHIVDAVYSGDHFEIKNWEVEHKYNLTNRWKLVWAYCIVKRKSSSKAIYNYVELSEYMGQSVWKTKPATMIKKVAEAQGLRQTFQELFAWTYDESEDWNVEKVEPKKPQKTESELKKELEEKQQNNFSKYFEIFTNIENIEHLEAEKIKFKQDIIKDKTLISKAQMTELWEIIKAVQTWFLDWITEAEILQETTLEKEDVQEVFQSEVVDMPL